MLDRAMGPMIPYLFNDNASLTDEYDGFTYYGNTISFGPNTNFSTPSLFGGCEYTPAKLNERSDESLADKQDETISVLPEIFTGNNYSCTFINPTYAGYQWIPDLTVFDDMEGLRHTTPSTATPELITATHTTRQSRTTCSVTACSSQRQFCFSRCFMTTEITTT